MTDNDDHSNTTADISLFYELALSIGSSLDLESNSAKFIKTILSRLEFSSASIWIKNKFLAGVVKRNGASLIYSYPEPQAKDIHISLNHYIFRSLRQKRYRFFTSDDPGYKKIVSEKRIGKGSFVLFSLNDIGVLQLFSDSRKSRFREKELIQFKQVISQFAISLEGCLLHQKTIREIAEHRQVEDALQQSETRYRSFFEDSPISLWEEDFSGAKLYLDGLLKKKPPDLRNYFDKNPHIVAECAKRVKVIAVNRSTLRMYKANNLKELRRGLSRVFTKESYEGFKEELISLSEGKVLFEIETLNRTLEGDQRHIRMTIAVISGYEETWSKIQVSIIDITERKQVEEALLESEERFQILAEKSPNMIFVNQGGQVVYANKKCEEVMGYSRDEFYASDFNFQTLISPEYQKIAMSAFEKHGRGEEVEPYEHALITKDGKRIESIIATKLIQYQGVSSILGIVTDITERKKLEEEFFKASKLESLGIMAGGIAHDFNNILTGILGNISLARMRLNSSELALDRLGAAEKATLRAKNLTQQLLTFSKGGTPVKIPVSLVEFLEDTIKFTLSGSNITYKISIVDNLHNISVDIGQIRQALENILINAIHAMPDGGTITVCAQNFIVFESMQIPLKEGKYIKLSISDTGIGIKEEHLPKIFDPFFSTKQKGSGLGLASTYSIIKNHGGMISVDSQVHRGTTFSIYLPASSSTKLLGKKEKTVSIKYRRFSGNVLIVDDEPIVRDVAKRILKIIGYNPTVTTNGKKGIELYQVALKRGCPYDAVLLDLTMPGGIGGKAVASKIRSLDPKATLIASSGYATDPILANFRKFGFDAALAKPYKIEELSDILEEVIGRKNFEEI